MTPEGQAYFDCQCGYRDFDFDANFCSRCGEKRPSEEERHSILNKLFKERLADLEAEALTHGLNRQLARKGGRSFIGDQE